VKRLARAVLGLVLPYLLLAWCALSGCALFKANDPRAERLDCQVRALEPLVGDLLDARQLVLDVYTGKASLGATLGALHATQAEVQALIEALQACEPPVPFHAGQDG
jgi:hypothetical protein